MAGVLDLGSAPEAAFLGDDAAALVVGGTVAHDAGRVHVLAGVG